MTTMTFETLNIKMADLGCESTVPPIYKAKNVQQHMKSRLEEEDGMYVGYGFVDDIYPYRKQDRYTREMLDTELPVVVLENDFLKAVFLPTLGGRLWQLYDKKDEKDLLLTNEEIAFANLALRDAWFCGGTEWNFGIIGHTPFTCAPLYTATLTADDGTPVLRFYEYERLRGCTYQVDCWLPKESERLYVGVRLVNPNEETVPTYWWSNSAVPEDQGARIIVPASEAYTTKDAYVYKVKEYKTEEKDITYPVQNPGAVDYFFKVKDAPHKYEAYVYPDGSGIIQASTSKQLGRKQFVWGQGQGGANWQKVLKTGGPTGKYVEIQAGLGQAQYECIPLAPNTAVSWVESYGAIHMDPAVAHGEYEKAKEAVDAIVAKYDMETVLENAAHMKRSADQILMKGSGWGALEEKNREGQDIRPLSYNLTFGNLGEEQQQWLKLIEEGTLGVHDPEAVPDSWIYGKTFTKRLEDAVQNKDSENWYTYLQLGVIYHVDGRLWEAEYFLKKSIELCENAWAHYALACLNWKKNADAETIREAVRTLEIKNDDVSLVRAVLDILAGAGEYALIVKEVENLSENVVQDGCIRLAYAIALLEVGDIDGAEAIAGDDPEFFAVHIREGDCKATKFWVERQKQILLRNGKDASNVEDMIPEEWDFRMN